MCISLIISLEGIPRLLRFESFSIFTFKLLFKMVSLLFTHINNVWAWHWALSFKKKKREKTKNLCLFVSWKMGSSCLVLSFFHVFIESFSFMNHLFVPFTGIYIWGKQLVLILMQFRCSKSKGNPKKKLMKLKAFWFIAVSFPRIPRQNVKEIGGFSRAQSFGLYASEPRNERQGTWI